MRKMASDGQKAKGMVQVGTEYKRGEAQGLGGEFWLFGIWLDLAGAEVNFRCKVYRPWRLKSL